MPSDRSTSDTSRYQCDECGADLPELMVDGPIAGGDSDLPAVELCGSCKADEFNKRLRSEVKECPYRGCDWSVRYDPESDPSDIAAEVDAEMHWENEHGGEVPEDAEFGDSQCPECWAMNGMDGSTSCGECGHIPEEVRA